MHRLAATLIVFISLASVAQSQEKTRYTIGIAIGFPPYQFTIAKQAAGIDADVTRLVFQKLGKDIIFRQNNWENLLLGLIHGTNAVDVLCGAELSPQRTKLLEFSDTYYQRTSVVFVTKGSSYQSLNDLNGKVVTGDKNSFAERVINRQKIRIMATQSKQESFRLLKENRVQAVIAPRKVGLYLSRQISLAIRIISVNDPGSPVAFAVSKSNAILARKISRALAALRKKGDIDRIMRKYR